MAPRASLPRPRNPPSTLCGSSTIRMGPPRGSNKIDRFLAAGLLVVLVEVVDTLLIDCADRHHHDLDVRTAGKIPDLTEFRRIVEEVLERRSRIERSKVVLGDLQRLVHALLDRDGRYDDDELGEAVPLVQLENRA